MYQSERAMEKFLKLQETNRSHSRPLTTNAEDLNIVTHPRSHQKTLRTYELLQEGIKEVEQHGHNFKTRLETLVQKLIYWRV